MEFKIYVTICCKIFTLTGFKSNVFLISLQLMFFTRLSLFDQFIGRKLAAELASSHSCRSRKGPYNTFWDILTDTLNLIIGAFIKVVPTFCVKQLHTTLDEDHNEKVSKEEFRKNLIVTNALANNTAVLVAIRMARQSTSFVRRVALLSFSPNLIAGSCCVFAAMLLGCGQKPGSATLRTTLPIAIGTSCCVLGWLSNIAMFKGFDLGITFNAANNNKDAVKALQGGQYFDGTCIGCPCFCSFAAVPVLSWSIVVVELNKSSVAHLY